MQVTLSVLIITFNQSDLLKRCIDSVLSQKLNIPYEIIISDAFSTDGTSSLLKMYQQLFGAERIKHILCDTNIGGATNRSECCGWMKYTAYLHAKGKYVINMDADDYYSNPDILQCQFDMLEKHPECTVCMHKLWQVNDGEEWNTGMSWPNSPLLLNGNVLTMTQIIDEHLIGQNQVYLMRRLSLKDFPITGCLFDDKDITYFHLSKGKCVFLDMFGYVWVQYKKSITHSASIIDNLISYGLEPLMHAYCFPQYAGHFIRSGRQALIHLMHFPRNSIQLDSIPRVNLDRYEGFLFDYYKTRKISKSHKVRAIIIRLLILLANKYDILCLQYYRFLYRIMTKHCII